MKTFLLWGSGVCLLLTLVAFFPTPLIQYEIAWIEGDFWHQPSGQVKWQKLENKTKQVAINPADKIKIGKGAQIIVTGKDGSGYLLNKAGVWRLQQLIDQPQIKSPSMVKQYLGFLMQHINHAEKSIDEYAEGYMRKKGLVNRGPGLTAPLMVSPQFESNLENETVTFLWKSKPRTTSYTFAIYDDWNANADPIFVKEVPDTTLQVSMDKALLESDRLYYWSVAPQNTTQSIRYAFKRLKNDDLKKFEEKLIALQTDLKFNKAMNAFLKAGLYEENYFYPEANRQFLNALELEPKNQLFRQSYALFLARHGQLDDAKKYLNM